MRLLSIFFLSLFFSGLRLQAQTIESSIKKFNEGFTAEKVYVHYDKPAYTAGETIWFKAYLLEGMLPAETTKTFYLDWFDENGNLLYHSVSPVYESSANGQFDIPVDYKGGMIYVRGYTRWMLNFDSAFLYKKNIKVLTFAKSSPTIVKKNTTLNFFPEGGDAIEAVANKIAFKATDQFGGPVFVKGNIETEAGRFVDSFKTVHDGMGFFYLFPFANEKYVARWKDEYGILQNSLLPIVKRSGINLKAVAESGKCFFTVTRNEEVTDNLKEGFLIGTINQQFAFKTGFNLKETSSVKKYISSDQLSTGILTITVFDKESQPVAERIMFINNDDYSITPEYKVRQLGLRKRALNEIEISVPDEIVANLSIAVTDVAIGTDSSENIFSSYLLTSDLRGYVHKPAYYFPGKSDSVKKHLDLVMLTNGWRRFNWNDLSKGQMPVNIYSKDTNYLSLSGIVHGKMKSTSKSDESIILLFKQKDSSSHMIVTAIEKDRRFNKKDLIFFDTLTVYHQFPKKSPFREGTIQYMPERLPALYNARGKNIIRFSSFISDTAGNSYNYTNALERVKAIRPYKGIILENVTVRTKTKSVIDMMDDKYTSSFFSVGDAIRFDLVNDPFVATQQNILSFLQGRIAGLQINTSGFQTSVVWRGDRPQFYLDEMQVDLDIISNLPVSDIAYVKVFRPPFFGGFGGGGGGAIALYTRKGDDFHNVPSKVLHKNLVYGYTEIREFYNPDYAISESKNEQADLRTTLYWNPMFLTTPGNTKKTFTFFNNDITEAFRIIMEGFTKNGQLVRLEQIID